jgi:hypothetical protein
MFSQIECSSCFAATPLLTNSITACEDWQSQMPGIRQLGFERGCRLHAPSQAITKNSSSSVISWTVTSGNAVTICCSGGRSALFLNSKSPIALLSARLPLTLPKSTKPPAAHIRAFSPSFCGLWSKDKGFALPLMPRTDRESPELPCGCQYDFYPS